MNYRPTPFFIVTLFAMLMAVIVVTVVFTAHNAAVEKQLKQSLNVQMCVSPTGHKKVPCP